MIEEMQTIPGINDSIWKALLPSQQLPFYGSRVPAAMAMRPSLEPAASSMKHEDVVRRALYSAALSFMSGGRLQAAQSRLIFPADHQRQHLQQSGLQLYGELIQHHQSSTTADNLQYQHQYSAAAAAVASSFDELHKGRLYMNERVLHTLTSLQM